MRFRSIFLLFLLPAALLLSGCGCDEESADQLCGDEACGVTAVIDGCDNEREVDCGECGAGRSCEDQVCVCEGESDEALCDERDLECGDHSVTDACGDSRTVECGACADPAQCSAGVCVCEPAPEGELCDAHDLHCGDASVTGRCGDTRDIACGGCPGDHDECAENVCECVGESEDELCDATPGACGTTEITDACGAAREVECDPCASGHSTFGAVRDADTGELLEDATIRVYAWPPPGGEDPSWFWEAGFRADDPDFETTTSASSGDINYEFASEGSMCVNDQAATLEAHKWYRYVVDRPGYAPSVFYRLHPGYEADDCAAECAASDDAACHRQDFELWAEDSTYPRKPNLVVDPRELQDTLWQCGLMPDDAPEDELVGFRAALGGMNTGHGPFHLEGVETEGDEGEVLQHIAWSDGSVESRVVPDSAFEFDEPHQHTHFLDWFAMRFVEPSDDCRDVDDRPDECVVDDGLKISFCLHDIDAIDGDIMGWHGGESAKFIDVCDTAEQGITQGWRDTYRKELRGQVIILGSPDEAANLGQQWLEAEVDPKRVLSESERRGNVARRLVEPPDEICGNPDKVLDCSMPRDEYETREQRRQCNDYLGYFD